MSPFDPVLTSFRPGAAVAAPLPADLIASLASPVPTLPVGEVSMHLLREMAARLAEAERTVVEQRERIEYLETLSMTDELTGLLNRRGFVDAFRRELATARRRNRGGVLVVIDLDGFKAINDTHGHLAGDTYLRKVARALKDNVRSNDVVARLGGDEFAVLLTDTAAETGLERARKLSVAVNGRTCTLGGKKLPLRASFGSEPYTGKDREDEVTLRADTLMYKVKAERKAKR